MSCVLGNWQQQRTFHQRITGYLTLCTSAGDHKKCNRKFQFFLAAHVKYLQYILKFNQAKGCPNLVALPTKQARGRVPCDTRPAIQRTYDAAEGLHISEETEIQYNYTYLDAGYPDQLGPLGKFVKNSTKLTCLEITGYWIKYSTVLWFLELQVRHGHMVQMRVRNVNSNN